MLTSCKMNNLALDQAEEENPSVYQTPTTPAPQRGNPQSTPATQSKKRKPARSPAEKLGVILDCIRDAGWSLSDFLFYLFRMEEERPDGLRPVERASQHARMVTSLLNGASKPRMGIIIDLIHRNSARVNYRQGDKTMMSNVFSPSVAFQDIEHARPALSTWAVHLVAELVSAEAKVMIAPETGLHLRA
jgi:hypothetical protein